MNIVGDIDILFTRSGAAREAKSDPRVSVAKDAEPIAYLKSGGKLIPLFGSGLVKQIFANKR